MPDAAPSAIRAVNESEYEAYIAAEWEMFAGEAARGRSTQAAVAGIEVRRVLDVGCGAGQELLPFASRGAFGVGADLAPETGRLARGRFARHGLNDRVAFVRATAESLPFASGAFDVLISRLALPYAHNPRAIAEFARVLRSGGLLLLKIHHAWFYVDEGWRGFRAGRLLVTVHAARVLCSGAVYHLTGKHVRNRLLTHETFQSRWLLERELARNRLSIVREMPDSDRCTPSFLIQKSV